MTTTPVPDKTTSDTTTGPLAGLRVIELAGIGPCPFAGMVLSDLGAEVLRIDRSSAVGQTGLGAAEVFGRGKRSVGLDLKDKGAVGLVLDLVERADALIEGYRPGVTERLGLGPTECLARNERLVYGRMTGWGQDGPLASHAGHDIDYIALSGVLHSLGRRGEAPVPPCNLVGDFGGGGMLLVVGVLAALFAVGRGGAGQVVDAAMVDGSALLSAMVWSLKAAGFWADERGTNLLDTGAAFYEVYECSDGRYVAVGALEPQFYSALCRVVGLDEGELPPQMDRQAWPQAKARLAEIFFTKSRDEWVALAAREKGDACLAPVLSMDEAAAHEHNAARQSFVVVDGVLQPAPAPRFSGTPARIDSPPRPAGVGGREALLGWGVEEARVDSLVAAAALACS